MIQIDSHTGPGPERTSPPRGSAPQEGFASEEARLASFQAAIDDVRKRVHAAVGQEDLDYIRRVDRFSRACEVAGRTLIHFSFEPLAFSAGVLVLWLSKQLQAIEIGHTALHGAFDKLPGAGRFRSKKFWWEVPIDEASWRGGHNFKHHQYTNVVGHDPDVRFGPVRLTGRSAPSRINRFQLPFTLLVLFPGFAFFMNMHFTGLVDVYDHKGDDLDMLPDRSRKSILEAHKRAFRKYLPYYAKEYVLFPMLAGPFFWKVMLGNWLADTMRNVYSAATIFCGHVGTETKHYAEKANGRAEWYRMQVEATNNFEVPHLVSVLCGALDRQIEHHLFPALPTNRLREIAPEVRAICEAHGVEYRTDTWPRTLGKALKKIAELSRDPSGGGLLAGARRAVQVMN
jgi:NADPH-dependent stearoyl-CoA 9-desaturase